MVKLLNLEEEAPAEFFIFVNQTNPATHHNFNLIGSFTSSAFMSTSFSKEILEKYLSVQLRLLPFAPCQMDEIALSPYCMTAINDYRIEYDAEVHRYHSHPLYPSRLSAIYAFKDYKTCVEVNKKYGWSLSEVQQFRLVDHQLNRVVKVNMEHVTLARHAYKISMLENIDRLWEGYWQGVGNIGMQLPTADFQRQTFESGIIWEYLIEGTVEKIKA